MRDFLSHILPPDGIYCVAVKTTKGFQHHMVRTTEEMETLALDAVEANHDAYYAVASFREGSTSRSAANAQAMRALFVDLDTGEGKPYADIPAAITALRAFLQNTALPRPVIVCSGNGLHAYWPFHDALEIPEWLGYAQRLKALCAARGLHIDPAITADAARILRIPGTKNFKGDEPKDVFQSGPLFAYGVEEVVPHLPAAPVAVSHLMAAKAFGTDDTTRALSAEDHPPSSFAKIIRISAKGAGCAQIKHAVEDAASLEEPLWRAALSIASRCVDGADQIHEISKAHPQYSAEETERKAQETKGPYTCDWYRSNNTSLCKGCPHQIGSPITLGRIVQEAPVTDGAYVVQVAATPDNEPTAPEVVTVEIPEYPHPFFRGSRGGVYRRQVVDDELVEVEIYPQDLYITGRFFDSDENGDGDGELVGINLHMPHDGVRRFSAKVSDLFAKDPLREALNRNGALVYGKQLDGVMAYFATSIRKLQAQVAAAKTRSQMGWTPDMQGFVVGELEYSAGGVRLAPPASGTRQLAPAFQAKGSLDEWKSIAAFYTRPGLEPHAVALLTGFASPLLKLIGGATVQGAMVHLKSSESGSGKTTVQMVVNSIFGRPRDLLMTKDDTYATKMHRIGMLNSICNTIDEITNTEDKILSEMVYGFTTGRARHRMESQTNKMRVNNTQWSTFTLSSGNASVTDKLVQLKASPDGELKRILELDVPVLSNSNKAEVDSLFYKLNDNYGLAGPVFIKFVMANRAAVESHLLELQRAIDAEFNFAPNDRFMSCFVTCIIGAVGFLDRLDLVHFEADTIQTYLKDVLKTHRHAQAITTGTLQTAHEAIGTFMAQYINDMLVSNAPTAEEPLPAAIAVPRGALRMRFEPNTKRLYIPSPELRAWFTARQIDVKQSIQAMTACGMLVNNGEPIAKRLSSGMVSGGASIPVRCYVFDSDYMGLQAPDGSTTDPADADAP